jgi:hypothetical protein
MWWQDGEAHADEDEQEQQKSEGCGVVGFEYLDATLGVEVEGSGVQQVFQASIRLLPGHQQGGHGVGELAAPDGGPLGGEEEQGVPEPVPQEDYVSHEARGHEGELPHPAQPNSRRWRSHS